MGTTHTISLAAPLFTLSEMGEYGLAGHQLANQSFNQIGPYVILLFYPKGNHLVLDVLLLLKHTPDIKQVPEEYE